MKSLKINKSKSLSALSIVALASLGLAAIVSACGGTSGWPRGTYCTEDINPIDLTDQGIANSHATKVDFKASLFAGKKSQLVEAEIFYRDDINKIRMNYVITKDTSGNFQMRRNCVAGLGKVAGDPAAQNSSSRANYDISASVIGLSDIQSPDGAQFETKVKKYWFHFANRELTEGISDPTADELSQLGNNPTPEKMFLQNVFLELSSEGGTATYQIRAHRKAGNNAMMFYRANYLVSPQ